MLFYHQFYIQFVNNFSFSILVLSRYLTAILSSSLQTGIFSPFQSLCKTGICILKILLISLPLLVYKAEHL